MQGLVAARFCLLKYIPRIIGSLTQVADLDKMHLQRTVCISPYKTQGSQLVASITGQCSQRGLGGVGLVSPALDSSVELFLSPWVIMANSVTSGVRNMNH